MARRVATTLALDGVQQVESGYKRVGAAAKQSGDTQKRAMQDAERAAQAHQQAVSKVGDVSGKAFVAMAAGTGLVTKSAMDWESAWAGVTKTVDGTPQQMAEIEGGLRGLARTLPQTHEQIAAVAESAGQLGVKRESIMAFTKTMVDLGETTNLTSDDAATSLAQFMNVMGTSQGKVSNLGSTLVALGNAGASTERDIMEMGGRIAAAGKQVGMTETDVLGFANALASAGINAEAGGSAISTTFKQIDAAARKGGDSLDLIAETAGMSASEFKKAWGQDAAGATASFIEGLGEIQKRGGSVSGVLDELGMKGLLQQDALGRMASATKNAGAQQDLLRDSLKLGAKAYQENAALTEEANKRYETSASKAKVAANQIKDNAITAGQAMLPMVADITSGVAKVTSLFGQLPTGAQQAAGAMAVIATAGVGTVAGVTKTVGALREFRDVMGGLGGRKANVSGVAAEIDGVGSAADRANGKANRLKGTLAFAGTAVAIAGVVDQFGRMAEAGSRGADTVGDLQSKMTNMSTGSAGIDDLSSKFKGLEGRVETVGEGFSFLNDRLAGNGTALRTIGDGVDGFAAKLIGADSDVQAVANSFRDMDTALTQMKPAQAASAFGQLAAEAQKAGYPVDQLAQVFPQYAASLQQAAGASGRAVTAQQALNAVIAQTPAVKKISVIVEAANAQTTVKGFVASLKGLPKETIARLKTTAETKGLAAAKKELAAIKDKTVKASVKGDTKGAKQTQAAVNALKGKTVTTGTKADLKGKNQTQAGVNALKGKTVTTGTKADLSGQKATQRAVNSTHGKTVTVSTRADTSGAYSAQRAVNSVSSRTVTITTIHQAIYRQSGRQASVPLASADGNIFHFYANGGMENHVAQIAPAGAWRVWAEEETGGEAYIPLALSKRVRSMAILEKVASMFGKQVVPNATGNVYSTTLSKVATVTPDWTTLNRQLAALTRAISTNTAEQRKAAPAKAAYVAADNRYKSAAAAKAALSQRQKAEDIAYNQAILNARKGTGGQLYRSLVAQQAKVDAAYDKKIAAAQKARNAAAVRSLSAAKKTADAEFKVRKAAAKVAADKGKDGVTALTRRKQQNDLNQQRAMLQAQTKVNNAQKAKNDALARYKPIADRATAAARKLTEAQQAMADTQARVVEAARATSEQFQQQYRTGGDVKDWLANMGEGAKTLATFASQIDQLRSRGLSEQLIQDIVSKGAGAGGELASEILVAGRAMVDQLNRANQNLAATGNRLGMTTVTKRMADGGVTTRQAQISSRAILWAEAGPEAYIPLDPAKRDRSTDILDEVAARFGYHLVKFANGGVFDPQALRVSTPAYRVPAYAGVDSAAIASAVRAGLSEATVDLAVDGVRGVVRGEIVAVRQGDKLSNRTRGFK